MKKTQYIVVVVSFLTTLACVTPAIPATLAILSSPTSKPPTGTPVSTPTPNGEVVGRVVADLLTIRSVPSDTGPELGYYEKGKLVAGHCQYYENGDIWLQINEHRFVAVVFEGRVLVEGICN